ncbi:MAG: glycosyltransferase [Phycisphaerae bacterium]|nr:glycosyltransferase [Phycisphaerae bacterium]
MSDLRGNVVVADAGASWIRSLFEAVASHRRVGLLTLHSAGRWLRQPPWRWPLPTPWQSVHSTIVSQAELWQREAPVPGWTRGRSISTRALIRGVRSAVSAFKADTAVFTLPFFVDAAEALSDLRRIYFAFDPYQYYGWPVERTLEQQRRMLKTCDAIFAVSRLLADDFRQQTERPVFYLPNAVSESFVQAMGDRVLPPPSDIAAIPHPIVGCTGQINSHYDWQWIGSLAGGATDVSFVFIGSVASEGSGMQQEMHRVLDAYPNIYLLGARPHDKLPAYLSNFDVCLNPLKVNDLNNRRSPLRLYDYLANARPILSTPIREAYEHGGLITIASDQADPVQMLRQMLANNSAIDLERRQEYIRRNTWGNRAQEFIAALDQVPS